MALYTVLSINEIQEIGKQFGIANINSYKVLSGGSENTNYLVNAAEDKFVLTICEQKSEENARSLADLLAYFEENNFRTSKIIRTAVSNDSIALWKGKPIMFKRFIEGKVIEDLPNNLLELIGIELGKLHKIKAPTYIPNQVAYGEENFSEVEKYAADSEFSIWLKEKRNYILPYLTEELPKSIIHSDLFADNVIISEDENEVQIMDFEEAAYYYRVFDIGMTIIGICRDDKIINFEKAKSFLKGYQQEIDLLEIEINALQAFTVYAGASMTFWRHMNFNFTKPDPTMSEHYVGLKVVADFIQEQPADCFYPK